jgi:predicted fused transcriptional regulator/phosphomethylpyrimidine kinase
MTKTNYIWEVFDLTSDQSIGFIKSLTYESAVEEAFKRYKRPVDIVYHDGYTEELRRNFK